MPVTLKYNYIFRINSTHIEQLNGEIFVLNVALLSYIDLNLQMLINDVNMGIIYYTTTCFHLQVIFFTNQLTIHSLFFVFIKLIILKLYTAHCKLA